MVALAAAHQRHVDGASAATAIFSALGLTDVQERESSNYVEGRYYRSETNDVSVTVSFGDSDEPDLPIWLLLEGPTSEVDALAGNTVEALRRSGFRLARLENFGKHDEERVDL